MEDDDLLGDGLPLPSALPDEEDNFREGVLLIRQDGVFVQRYFSVYNYKMSYSHRGRERKQEFTPLTVVSVHEEQFDDHLFPLTVSTPGQPPYELAADTRNDLEDWVRAVQEEVTRLVTTLNLEYERKGHGDFAASMQGSLLEEGRFASYVFRKQREQVVPIFLSLGDGKLTARKLATLKSAVGVWRVSPHAEVSIVPDMAAPAFQIDKETLIVANEGVRSNWIVALKSTIAMASGTAAAASGKTFHEVDFGNPSKYTSRSGRETVKLPAHLRLRQTGSVSAEEQDEFFLRGLGAASSIGGSGAADFPVFSTFMVNDDVDDSEVQENFRRLRLSEGTYGYDGDDEENTNGGGAAAELSRDDASGGSPRRRRSSRGLLEEEEVVPLNGEEDEENVFESPAALLALLDEEEGGAGAGGGGNGGVGKVNGGGTRRVPSSDEGADVWGYASDSEAYSGFASSAGFNSASPSFSMSQSPSPVPSLSSMTGSFRAETLPRPHIMSTLASEPPVPRAETLPRPQHSFTTDDLLFDASAPRGHMAKSASMPGGDLEGQPVPSRGHPGRSESTVGVLRSANSGIGARGRSTAAFAGAKRIRLTQKNPEGPVRVYGGDLRTGELSKTVLVSSDMTTMHVLELVLQKYDLFDEKAMCDFTLVEEEVGTPYVRVLDDLESPLIARLNWDTRHMQFVVRLRNSLADVAVDAKQFFRVTFADGSGMTLTYNENLPSMRVCELVAQKANLQQGSVRYFALWMDTPGLSLQLEPYQLVRVLSEDWPSLAKRYVPIGGGANTMVNPSGPVSAPVSAPASGSSPGSSSPPSTTPYSSYNAAALSASASAYANSTNPEAPPFQIVFRRWAFLSVAIERRIKDKSAISLLCKQAITSVLCGLYPCNEYDAVFLAALQCQIVWGDYDEQVHMPGLFQRQPHELKQLVPGRLLSAPNFKVDVFEGKLLEEYKSHKGKQTMIAELLYLQYVRQWPFYGSTFFPGRMQMAKSNVLINKATATLRDESKKGTPIRLGINAEGVHVFDAQKQTLLLSQELDAIELVRNVDRKSVFAFRCRFVHNRGSLPLKDRDVTLVTIVSQQAPLIHQFMFAAAGARQKDLLALQELRNTQKKRAANPSLGSLLQEHASDARSRGEGSSVANKLLRSFTRR